MAIEVYKGNTKLKSAGVKTDMTRKHVEEITRCFEDPIYFIESYVNIVHVDKGLVPFKLYDYQKKMVDLILKERFVIMKLPRQSGKTATTAACVLWYLLIEEFKTVAILANKGSTAREILNRIKTMYENLPKFLQVGVVEWNKGSITLGNGNKCIAAATSNSAIRGCIHGETILSIKDNGIVKNITIEQLFNDELNGSNDDFAKNNKNLLIEAPNGFVSFDSVVRYKYDTFLVIKTNNGDLIISHNHPVFTDFGWKQARTLKIGDILIKKDGVSKITEIVEKNEEIYLYDIINASG